MIKRLLIIFILLSGFFLYPKKVNAQVCTNTATLPNPLKIIDSVTFSATFNQNADNFYFEARNWNYKQSAELGSVICVTSGFDVQKPATVPSECPTLPDGTPTYPLVFKDLANAVNNMRSTGTRTIQATQLNVRDYNQQRPWGTILYNIQIIPYTAVGAGPWSAIPVGPACTGMITGHYRPPVCQSMQLTGGNLLTTSNQLTVTLVGSPPAGTTITDFQLSFLNMDNLYGPGPPPNPRPIFHNGTQLQKKEPASPAGANTHVFQIFYTDLDYPDENWNNQYPVSVSATGYFYLNDSGFSAPEGPCTAQFTIQRGPTLTPTPTQPGAATPTPTIPPPAWHSPDGQICNDNNYIVYYTGTDCTNTNPADKSYSVKDFTPQGQCSDNGSGKCFRVAGNPVNRLISSYWQFNNQACTAVTVPYSPANTYDTLYNCLFAIPPVATISGQVTLDFISKNQFNKVFIWLNDVREKFLRNIEIPKNTIQSGQPFNYQFNNLFPDRKYDVYVLAYGVGGIVLENVEYMGSCQSPACRLTPPGIIDFSMKFLPPPAGSSAYLSSNVAFQDFINKWRAGQIGPIEMSKFIDQLPRVPGLQKAICDPLVPDGCRFIP